jgi:hypothetical protein
LYRRASSGVGGGLDKGRSGCGCAGRGKGGRGLCACCDGGAQGAGALCALRAAGYGAVLVGGADGGAGAAEAGGVEGGARVVVCCAGIAVLAREERVGIFGCVVGGCDLGEGGLEGCDEVGRSERGERDEE